MKHAETFFNLDERARIEAAVRAAESRTCGEIVPLLVDRCNSYGRSEVIVGGSFAMAIALVCGWLWAASSEWAFLGFFLVLIVPCCWLLRSLPPLHRFFIPKSAMAATVSEEAVNIFFRHGLYRTHAATGILIFISLFERRVVVLADRGINEQVPPQTWDEIVTLVTEGLRTGTACDSLCQAIDRCGELLAERFPVQQGDRDELPNFIIGRSRSATRIDNGDSN